MKALLVLLGVAATPCCAESRSEPKMESSPWTLSASWRAAASNRTASPVPKVSISLDVAPENRWDHVTPAFVHVVPAIMDYLKSEVPGWALPLLSKIGASVRPYFGAEYGAEMEGLAKGLGLDPGYIVFLNLIMQVEGIGINCSNWNSTGPTHKDDPGCTAVDPSQKWCYCKDAAAVGAIGQDGMLQFHRRSHTDGPGLCTSVVAQTPAGTIFHGRNLDWNLPPPMRALVADVEYTRANQTIAKGTGAVGFVGVFNGMVQGGFSASINARGKGGKLLTNVLQALLHKSTTPCMHLRSVLTSQTAFEPAVAALSSGEQVDENYFIVAGVGPGEGAVIARDRKAAADTWRLNSSEPNGWFRLQTNYDHWNPVPTSDDRRTPGVTNMEAMGQDHIAEGPLLQILEKFPTFNPHTDYTGVFHPADGSYTSMVWSD